MYNYKKLISCILTVCIVNYICCDICASVIAPVNITSVSVDNADYFIPADLGKVIDDVYIGAEKTLINIQDLHSDKNTQENIAVILDFLTKNYNVENIYLEGAVKDLDFNWLKAVKDEKVRNNIIYKMKKSETILFTKCLLTVK